MSRSLLVLDCSAAHGGGSRGSRAGSAGASEAPDFEDVEPGQMRIARARLSRPLAGARGLLGWRASTEGSVVRQPQRWAIDRAIFRRRGSRGRGTVLVDTSGSMSLGDGDLDNLLAMTGQRTRVAIYSGQGKEGELRIVADAGWRAEGEALARFGGGNIVDVPALRWLARQPAPRVWISDGRVTGIGDRGSPRLRALCRALCRRSGIRRVEDIASAARLFGR